MKILHTSDWHLGQVLYGYDRLDEYAGFFSQLKDIARKECPDALVVSGDIFDVSAPSATVARMFKDNILDLHEALPDMTIVITAGNHDSASRIDVDRNLWRAGGIHVIGGIRRVEGEFDFSDLVVEIPGKGRIVAVPYLNAAFLPKKSERELPEMSFFGRIGAMLAESACDGLPTVLMAHLTVAGCDMTGHRISPIGGMQAVDPGIFGEIFDYVALGHIHKPQQMDGGRVTYCGTPMAVSFDEVFEHGVNIVNVEKGKAPEIEQIPIMPVRELLTIPADGGTFKEAIKLFRKLDNADPSYIRLNVVQEEPLPVDCLEVATEIAKEKSCRFCTYKYTRRSELAEEERMQGITAFEFRDTTPCDIAARFFRSRGFSQEVTDDYVSLIAEIESEIAAEQNR